MFRKKVAIRIIALSLLTVSARPAEAQFAVVSETIIDLPRMLSETVKKVEVKLIDVLETVGIVAFKQALRNYVNNIAYQSAVYIASGGTGQKPAFEHRTVGQILVDEADIAVGDALDNIFASMGNNNFCNLDPKIAINLSADALIKLKPTAPTGARCSVSQAAQRVLNNVKGQQLVRFGAQVNIDVEAISPEESELQKVNRQFQQASDELTALSEKTFDAGSAEAKREEELFAMMEILAQKQKYLEPIVQNQRRSATNLNNDVVLGAFLQNLQSNPLTDAQNFQLATQAAGAEAKANATLNIQSGLFGQILPPTTAVLGFAKTPVSVATDLVKQGLAKVGLPETTFTGNLIADAADTFFNTLAQRLLQKFLYQGLVNPPEPNESGFYASGVSRFGRTQAQQALADFVAPNFSISQTISPITELAACPDPNKPGLENCVLDNGFRQAIEQGLTVRQALAKGYLKGDATFGYGSSGENLTYLNGYSYRSMVILRKYRVLPIGWELAAQWIGDSALNTTGKAFTLQQVINGFNDTNEKKSDFYQLVDPDWVLTLPEAACFKRGPGPEILARQTIQGAAGGESFREIIQRGDYCADVKTCLQKRDDGSCKSYGYCLEEEEIFKPAGTACPAYGATCTVYKKVNGNESLALLSRTLDGANVCTAQDNGCRWYAQDKNKDGTWQGNASSRIFFNSQAGQCPIEQQGCSLYYNYPDLSSVASASSGLANGSFEYDAKSKGRPDGWNISGTAIYSGGAWHGARALSFQSDGGLSADTIPLASGTWTASIWCRGTSGCTLDFNGDTATATGDNWTQAKVTVNVAQGEKASFKVYAKKDVLVDGAMVVASGTATTGYKDYGEVGANKLFLNSKSSNSVCNATTAGTKIYTDEATGLKFAGKIDENNFCPASCVGYTQWNQEPFGKEKAESKTFIQSEAKMCQASSVGCEGFVNLEAKNVSGENVKYFSRYQQCLPWDEAEINKSRGTYYSWVGSDKAGFELKAWYFEKGAEGWPALAQNNIDSQNDLVCKADDTNPDCVTLYKQGDPENSKIINVTLAKEVSKDCQRFRRQTTGDTLAINPNRANSCQAAEVGCRRYTGKRAALSKVIYREDFEKISVPKDWNIIKDAKLIISSNASQFLKHSLGIYKDGATPTIYTLLPQALKVGASYQMQIWGKGGSASLYFTDDITKNSPQSEQVTLTFGSDWNSQQAFFDDIKAEGKYLVVVSASEKLFFDALAIRESQDEFYAVKDSWSDRAECSAATKNGTLSCNAYATEDGQRIYATSLVPSSPAAIGCRAVVETANSPFPNGLTIDDADKAGRVINNAVKITLPEHKVAYRIVTTETSCQPEFMGCRAMGAPNSNSQGQIVANSFATVFVKDNPFDYPRTLCASSNGLACEAYTANVSGKTKTLYFKDPGAKKCEFRENQPGSPSGWYLVGSEGKKRCEMTNTKGQTLTVQSQCRYYFPPDKNSNIKEGWYRTDGTACNFITRRITDASRLCTPVIKSAGGVFDWLQRTAWAQSGGSTPVIVADGGVDSVCLPTALEANSDPLGILPYDKTRLLSKENGELDGLAGACNEQFNSCSQYVNPEPAKIDFVVSGVPFVSGTGRAFYALSSTVDKESCNGQVNRAQGCRLFNQAGETKIYQSAGDFVLENKLYKATAKIKDGESAAGGDKNDSNVLLSVKKERQCSSWLACRSAIVDTDEKGQPRNLCLSVGACNQLSDSGEACLGPVSPLSLPTGEGALERSAFRNISGFGQFAWSSVNAPKDKNGLQVIVAPVDFAAVDQVGRIAFVPNGNFEQAPKDNNEPAFWQLVGTGNNTLSEAEIKAKGQILSSVATVRTFSGEPASAKIYEGNSSVKISQNDFADTNSQASSLENISLASNSFSVSTNSTYVVSAKVLVNSLEGPNISSFQKPLTLPPPEYIGLSVFCKDENGSYSKMNQNNSLTNATSNVSEPSLGQWQTLLFKFSSGTKNSCRILVGFIGSSQKIKGSFYVDDVDIQPVLEVYQSAEQKKIKNPMVQVARSCRLYPSSSANSCIAEENGKTMFGQQGYCYTEDPNDVTKCLQWWPIDLLQGEALRNRLTQFTPYKGPKPLYMCVLGRGNSVRNISFSSNINDGNAEEKKNHKPLPWLPSEHEDSDSFEVKNYKTGENRFKYSGWKDAGGEVTFKLKNFQFAAQDKKIRKEDINYVRIEVNEEGNYIFYLSGQTDSEVNNQARVVRKIAKSKDDSIRTEYWVACKGENEDKLRNMDLDNLNEGCPRSYIAGRNAFEGNIIFQNLGEGLFLDEISLFYRDVTGKQSESSKISVSIGLKEYCLAFAEVADESGRSMPWAQKFLNTDGWQYSGVILPANNKNFANQPFGASTFTGAKNDLKQVVPISATDDPAGMTNVFGGTSAGTILYGGVPLACEGVCGAVGSVEPKFSSDTKRARSKTKSGVCDGTGKACAKNSDCLLGTGFEENTGSEICYGVPTDVLPDNLMLDPKNNQNYQKLPRNKTFLAPNEVASQLGKDIQISASTVLASMFPVAFKTYCWNGQRYVPDTELDNICEKQYGLPAKVNNQVTAMDYTRIIHQQDKRGPENFKPSVSNVRLTCRGDKSLQVEFSANANPEHLPIVGLKVNWGDGEDYISNLSLEAQRIKLYHTYNSAEIMKQVVQGKTIKIGVQDNWGWCSTTPSNKTQDQHSFWPNSCLDGDNQTKLSEIGATIDRCNF